MVFAVSKGAAADDLAGEVEVDVALVEQDVDLVLVGESDDGFEVRRGDDRSGGIRWCVEDDRFGARRDRGFDHLRSDAEVFVLAALDGDNDAAGVLDDVLEGDPVGDGQDDFVAVVDEHLDRS